MEVIQLTMSRITPMDEFKEIVGTTDLTEEQLEVFRDLVDVQTDAILDAFIAKKQHDTL